MDWEAQFASDLTIIGWICVGTAITVALSWLSRVRQYHNRAEAVRRANARALRRAQSELTGGVR